MTYAERMKGIKERQSKASIGPWSVQVNRAYHISYILRSAAGNKIAQFFNWQDIGFDVNSESNSNFIAHARADIPYLVARVEDLESALGGVYAPEIAIALAKDAEIQRLRAALRRGVVGGATDSSGS